jgi:hypothetical protein
MNRLIAGQSLCFQPCRGSIIVQFLFIPMVRVLLLYPTSTPVICLSRYLFFFASPLCSRHAAHIFLSYCILCLFHLTRVSQVVCFFFFLKFSVLYFADKASKLITFLSPSFVNYFS